MTGLLFLTQLIGLLAIAFEVGSYQPKKRKNILLAQMIGNLLWVVHFMLLAAPTGAALNAIGAIRAYSFNKFRTKKRPGWLLVIILILIWSMLLLTWQGALSLLPVVGMSIATIGMWQLKEQRIRQIVFFSWPLWLAYNLAVGSYAGVINELLIAASIATGLWRYRKGRVAAQPA